MEDDVLEGTLMVVDPSEVEFDEMVPDEIDDDNLRGMSTRQRRMFEGVLGLKVKVLEKISTQVLNTPTAALKPDAIYAFVAAAEAVEKNMERVIKAKQKEVENKNGEGGFNVFELIRTLHDDEIQRHREIQQNNISVEDRTNFTPSTEELTEGITIRGKDDINLEKFLEEKGLTR